MSKRRRVLVTGGAGFIGSHVAEAFLTTGFEVAIVDNLSTGRRENVPGGAEFYPFDIKSPDTFDSSAGGSRSCWCTMRPK